MVVIFNLPISNHTQLFFLFPLVIIARALKTLFTCWSLTYLLISLCVPNYFVGFVKLLSTILNKELALLYRATLGYWAKFVFFQA